MRYDDHIEKAYFRQVKPEIPVLLKTYNDLEGLMAKSFDPEVHNLAEISQGFIFTNCSDAEFDLIAKARKGTPQYEAWLKKFREKRGAKKVETGDPKKVGTANYKRPAKTYSANELSQNPPANFKGSSQDWKAAVKKVTKDGSNPSTYAAAIAVHYATKAKEADAKGKKSYKQLKDNPAKGFKGTDAEWKAAVESATDNGKKDSSYGAVMAIAKNQSKKSDKKDSGGWTSKDKLKESFDKFKAEVSKKEMTSAQEKQYSKIVDTYDSDYDGLAEGFDGTELKQSDFSDFLASLSSKKSDKKDSTPAVKDNKKDKPTTNNAKKEFHEAIKVLSDETISSDEKKMLPDAKDLQRVNMLDWSGKTFTGNSSPIPQTVNRSLKNVSDVNKLKKRAVAVHVLWGEQSYNGPRGASNPWKTAVTRLKELGATSEDISAIKTLAGKISIQPSRI